MDGEATELELPYGRRWWWVLRRLYDIPDIVTDARANTHLAQKINERATADPVDGTSSGGAAISIVMGLAQRGELDDLLLDPDIDVRRKCEIAAANAHWPPVLTKDAVALAVQLSDALCAYVLAHPHESEPPYELGS